MKRKRSATSKLERVLPDKNLPIRRRENDILKALSSSDVLILVAETGSGKTTQLPQMIVETQSSSSVLVTQPRRVAAISVAMRVATERGCVVGEQVGYTVRFDDKSTRGVTRIRYITDGVMLREALTSGMSNLHHRYSHIIIDEIHERSVNTDLVLGIIKQMLLHVNNNTNNVTPGGGDSTTTGLLSKLKMRSSLPFKVILMSATTDTNKLKHFFTHDTQLKVGMLNVEGKLHNVRVLSATQPVPDFVDSAVDTCLRIIGEPNEGPGDILVFLPGQDDIMSANALLRKRLKETVSKETIRMIQIHSLFSAMMPEDQLRAVQPLPAEYRQHGRKVIFATNIAETSVTIPGIRYVVDTGLMKVRESYSNKRFKGDILHLDQVSKAQADQRKGRAGRTGPGVLYRLYTEEQYQRLKMYPTPEILRSEATGTLLQIIALSTFFPRKLKNSTNGNEKDDRNDRDKVQLAFLKFPLLDKIPTKEMEFGLETLSILSAVDGSFRLTRIGELMSRLPVSPMLARCLLESLRLGCVEAMVSVAAMLSVDGLLFVEAKGSKREKILNAQRRFLNINGDHLTSANALHAVWQAMKPQKRIDMCKEYFLNYRCVISAISIRGQILKIMEHGDMKAWGLENKVSAEVEAEIADAGMDELVRRCLVAGFFRNVAYKADDKGYVAIGRGTDEAGRPLEGNKGDIHPSSVLFRMRRKRQPSYVLYHELVSTSKPYFRTVSVIERRWLSQHSNYYSK